LGGWGFGLSGHARVWLAAPQPPTPNAYDHVQVKRIVSEALAGKATAVDPFAARSKEWKGFKSSYLGFWAAMVAEAQDSETLVAEDPFEEIVTYLTCFSQSTVRQCRLPATLAALALMDAFIRVANKLRESRDTTTRQVRPARLCTR